MRECSGAFGCNSVQHGNVQPEFQRAEPGADVFGDGDHRGGQTAADLAGGGQGAVYARANGESGVVPAKKVDVIDTTGAGDAFFAGTTIGLTYGKTLAESCEIGSRLAASVICITENVCPRFRPLEFGLNIPVVD